MMEWFIDAMPLVMMVTLAGMLLIGYPVAFVLAGVGVLFAVIGWAVGEFPLVAFFNIPLRVWGSINASLIYPAVPMLLLMGIALERSGVAGELLECLQRLLRRVPGNLAVSMTLMGIILAPSAGLVGASVVTLALIGLPTMLRQGYRPSIAAGSVAAAGTLGIILPPGVMLFFLADLFRVQIAAMFMSTLVPAFAMAGLFIVYYVLVHIVDRDHRPTQPAPWAETSLEFGLFVLRSLVLPVALVGPRARLHRRRLGVPDPISRGRRTRRYHHSRPQRAIHPTRRPRRPGNHHHDVGDGILHHRGRDGVFISVQLFWRPRHYRGLPRWIGVR